MVSYCNCNFFQVTDGWLNRWKKRYGLNFTTLYGEAAEADVAGANKWKAENITELLESYSPSEIYNADETAFHFRALPTSTHLAKGKGHYKEC